MPETKRSLKVFLCHAHADRDPISQGDDVRGLLVVERRAELVEV